MNMHIQPIYIYMYVSSMRYDDMGSRMVSHICTVCEQICIIYTVSLHIEQGPY